MDAPEDRLFPTNNRYEIPVLRIDRQPQGGLLLPFSGWGIDSRQRTDIGTYHTYVDDYRFSGLWKHPERMIESGCKEVIEPNFSLFDTTPIAFGLQQIYKKRWIARYWQENGLRVYADLNVSDKFAQYNTLGIPDGYNAFATRGYADRTEHLQKELQTARDISGLDRPNVIVYGGGAKVRDICISAGVIYVEQFMTKRHSELSKQRNNGQD